MSSKKGSQKNSVPVSQNENRNPQQKDRRRAKYGSLSIVFTVVFVALIIVINLVFSSLSLSGDLTVDLTKEEFTAVSDETRTLINAMGDGVETTIYFLADRDTLSLQQNEYKGINLTGIIRDLAETYEKEFPGKLKVEYKRLGTDPEFESKYTEEAGMKLAPTSIIVQGKHHFRLLDMKAFFEMDEDGNYYSFNGEYRLTSAILQSSIKEPQVVTLTEGHGEKPSLALAVLLQGAGFEVVKTNIAQDEINPRTEMIICADPQTDFSNEEIDRISTYLRGYNGFVVMVDSETPRLPNLLSFLDVSWGIGYRSMHRITDEKHSLGNKNININAKYPLINSEENSKSAAYQIYKAVADMDGKISTVMPNCVELYVRDKNTRDEFIVEKVLTTYDTAVVDIDGLKSEPAETPIMLLSTKTEFDKSIQKHSYVLLSGSTDFASDANISAGNYGNKRVTLAIARTFSANRVAPDIKSKPFGDTKLNIEAGTAKLLTVLICTVVPLAVLICGIVMFLRRRHL